MSKLDEVIKVHRELCDEARAIIETKGHDYNRTQQNNGDTLFNLKVACLLGVVDSNTQSVLVRLSDKLMRLISLTKEPSVQAQVKDESVRDTIKDMINYATYLYVFYREAKNEQGGSNQV